MVRMDTNLARWLNDLATSHHTVGDLSRWSAQNMAVVLVVTLVFGWVLLAFRAYRTTGRLPWRLVEVGVVACLAACIGLAANQLLGHLWFRVRPYDAIANIHPLLPPSPDPSFPSDHATAAFALTTIVVVVLPRFGLLLLIEAILLLTSRVAVGLHYPGDILGGLLVALAATAVAVMLVHAVRRFLLTLATTMVRSLRFPVQVDTATTLPRQPVRLVESVGLVAGLLGLPFLLEALADPIKADPEWLEMTVQAVIVVGLAGLSVFLLRKVVWLNPRRSVS
jgi:undecaprenyl-diphosphatase